MPSTDLVFFADHLCSAGVSGRHDAQVLHLAGDRRDIEHVAGNMGLGGEASG